MALRRSEHSFLVPGKKNLRQERRHYTRKLRRNCQLEKLEERMVLAVGPVLVGIIPNRGDLLQNGDLRHEAPRELTFRFQEGEAIDPNTLAGIRLQSAGLDGALGTADDIIVAPGFIGVNDAPSLNEVVMRFKEPLIDDKYRIRIFGTDVAGTPGQVALRDTNALPFNMGVTVNVDFELDLGAQVIAVVPQPITRNANNSLTQARNQIVVYFNNDDLNVSLAQNTTFYQLIFTNDTATTTDDTIYNPQSVAYNAANDTATLTFASDISLLRPTGSGIDAGAFTYRLRIGNADPLPLAPQVQSIVDTGSGFGTSTDLGTLANRTRLISSAIDPEYYPLQFPGSDIDPGHIDPQDGGHFLDDALPDTTPGITTQYYNFQEVLETDANGLPLFVNLITDAQKQRAREVFQFISHFAGINFVETADQGITVATGDFAILGDVSNPGGVIGLAGTGPTGNPLALMDNAETGTLWGDSEAGGAWFATAMHEIGHLLGLDHADDVPAYTVMASGTDDATEPGPGAAEQVFPGDNDIVHLQQLYRPESKDIDIYKFRVDTTGVFSAELVAERLANSSQLNGVISIFDHNGNLISRNDDYYGEDSYVETTLVPGDYYVAISSTGNTAFDPHIEDSGLGGTTQGKYDLRLNFKADQTAGIKDTTGTLLDGDLEGTPGGAYNFWFKGVSAANTLFVDKASTATTGTLGSLANPYKTIAAAFTVATPGKVVRIVGNNFANDNGTTPNLTDNLAYEIGRNSLNQILSDGENMRLPTGVTVMVDAGAVFKLRRANIDVGSFQQGLDSSLGHFQVLGTPTNSVFFTSYQNESLGKDTFNLTTTPSPGDWGGLVFRNELDFDEGHKVLEDQGIFLNYVNHANISYGGGDVTVNTGEETFSSITMNEARPTISFSYVHDNAVGALAADPNSFKDSKFHDSTYESDYERVGPAIVGNKVINNAINGLFISISTDAGKPLDKLEVTGRFDDDIVHVLTEQLIIEGSAGGRILDEATGQLVPRNRTASYAGGHARLTIDPGIVVKLSGARIEAEMGGQLIAEGRATTQTLNDTKVDVVTGIVFTSLYDNRYGASGTFQTAGDDPNTSPARGNWGGLYFGYLSSGSLDRALVTYAGGDTSIEGVFATVNPIEIHQAQVRIAHSTIEQNADGFDNTVNAGNRNGRGANADATIFIRGAQPSIVDTIIRHNDGDMISINVNSLNSQIFADPGRSRGPLNANTDVLINRGPYFRDIRVEDNDVNGLVVRGGTITTQVVFDDTDIVHVVRDEIFVANFHGYGGLLLESRPTESLVIKLDGATQGNTPGNTAGFTAGGSLENIRDRIGGALWVVGQPGRPVVFTSLADDSVGAGLTPAGNTQTDTNNDGNASLPTAGDWRSLKLDRYSSDRNVEIVREAEEIRGAVDVNGLASNAQQLSELGPSEKDTDDNRRLGFEIQGIISTVNGPSLGGDVDVYSFKAKPGTEVWIDIDRTSNALDTVLELIDGNGNIVANSQSSFDESADPTKLGGSALVLQKDEFLDGDFYAFNTKDAGLRVVLPGGGTNALTYYVRVRANSADLTNLEGGITQGAYSLQIRLQEQNDFPGSTIRYADIRYATRGVEVLGKPEDSPLIADAGETTAANNTRATAQDVGALTASSSGSIGIAGSLSSNTDQDWYMFITDGGPVDFDIDYADGMGRPDVQLSIYDITGRLILVATDSNVAEDRPSPLNGSDIADLSRGSVGGGDPFLGNVNLPPNPDGSPATYYVAVSHALGGPTALSGTTARREPINSLTRIAEDHISTTGGMVGNTPETVLFGTTPIKTTQQLLTNVDPWFLGDVSLYVNLPGTTAPNLFVVDPFTGEQETTVGTMSGNITTSYNDIAMRNDGFLYSITSDATIGPTVAGNYRRISTANAAISSSVDDQIQTYQVDPNTGALIPYNANGGGVQFEAITEEPGGTRRVYAVGNIVQPTVPLARSSNLLYILDSNGVVIDDPSDGNPDDAELPSDAHPRGRLIAGQSVISPNATDIFGSAADQNYANPGDVRDGTRIQVTSDSGLTLTFELDSGPDIRTSGFGAEALRDGDNFTLSDGSFTRTFEFNSGPVLVMQTAGAAANTVVGAGYADGDTFTIADNGIGANRKIVTFEFDKAGGLTNPTNVSIAFTNATTQIQMVGAIVNAINNANFLVNASFSVSPANLGRISLTNDTAFSATGGNVSFQGDSLVSRMLVLTGATGADLTDGNTFTITDNSLPVPQTFVFELNNTSVNPAFTAGRRNINFTNASTALQIGQAIANSINAVGGGFTTTAQALTGQAAGRVIIRNFANLTETGTSVEFENVVGMNFEETDSFATMDSLVTGSVSTALPTIRTAAAHRSGSFTPFNSLFPTVGDRITFYGATLADFSNVNSWTVQNNLFNTGPAATGIANSSDIAVPFDANDTATDMAANIVAAINASSVFFPAFGVTAVQRGDIVELIGSSTATPPVVDPPLSIGGGGPGGNITGLAQLNGVLYAITDAGGLYIVNNRFAYQAVNPDFTPVNGTGPSLTYVTTSEEDLTGIDFEGLSAGPPDVEDGLYANTLFAIADDGQLYAFNTAGELQPIFIDGSTSVDTGLQGARGLAFSTLDYNLWNPTLNRGADTAADAGHGINPTYDGTRTVNTGNGQSNVGGTSYYFGLENPLQTTTINAQPGASNYLLTNPAAYYTYNLPDGAHGTLTTNTFSLKNYTAQDQPVLYFNYYYEAGNNANNDVVKVYSSSDGANWTLLTNALTRNSGAWRQARLSLGGLAGQDNVRLRFDFSTSGDLEVGDNNVTGSYLTAIPGTELVDGDTFTIGDTTFEFDMGYSLLTRAGAGRTTPDGETYTVVGPNGAATFELDNNGDFSVGNVAVGFNGNDSAADMARHIADAVNAAGLGVVAFAADERVHLAGALDVNQNILPQMVISLNANTGYSLFTPTGGGASQPDGETFTVTSNFGEFTFEMDDDGVASPGNIPVRFTNVDSAAELAQNIALSVNAVFANLGVTAASVGNQVTLQDAVYVSQMTASTVPLAHSGYTLDVPLTGGAGVNDGETFTVIGSGGPVTFEMDSDGVTANGNTPITFLLGDTALDIAANIVAAVNSAQVNGLPLDVLATSVGNQVTLTNTAFVSQAGGVSLTLAASNFSAHMPANGGAGLPDGTTITVTGPGGTRVFEFDNDGITSPGTTVIDFLTTDAPDTLATALATAVNGTLLGVIAVNTTGEVELQDASDVQVFVPRVLVTYVSGTGFSLNLPAGTSLLDGNIVTLTGPTGTATFEFDNDGFTRPGNVAVPYTALFTADVVAQALANAITLSGIGVTVVRTANQLDLSGATNVTQLFVPGIVRTLTPANLSLLTPANGGLGVPDGQTFTINGPSGALTFEMDSNGATTAGNIPVVYLAADSAATLAQNIAFAVNALFPVLGVAAGSTANAVTLQSSASLSQVAAPAVTLSPSSYLLDVPAIGGLGVTDGTTFTVVGPGGTAVFEMDGDGITTSGNIPVTYLGADTANTIAQSIATAVNAATVNGSPLGVTAANVLAQVTLDDTVVATQDPASPFTLNATGFLAHAPATGGLGVVDGTLLTVTGIGGTAIFELDRNGISTPGNVAVTYLTTDTPAAIALKIATAVNAQALGVNAVNTGGNVDLQFATDATLFVPQLNIAFTPGTGFAVSLPAGIALADGTKVTVVGRTGTKTFEFDSNGSFTAGNVAVNYTAATTATNLATLLRNAINLAGLGVTAAANGSQVNLTAALDVNQVFGPGLLRSFALNGFSLAVPATGGLDTPDGQTITVTGPTGTVTLEMDSNSVFTAGNTPLVYTSTTSAGALATLIANAVNAANIGVTATATGGTVSFLAASNVTIDTALGLTLDGDAPGTVDPGNFPVPVSMPMLAGDYSVLAPVTGEFLVDGETFTVTGPLGTRTFEFDNDGFTGFGTTAIDYLNTESASTLATNIATAINNAFIGVTAKVLPNGIQVDLISATSVTQTGIVGGLTVLDDIARAIGTAVDQAFTGGRSLQAVATGSTLQAAAPGIDFQSVSGANIVDGQTFNLTDGVVSVTFEMNSGGGVSGTNTSVPFAAGNSAFAVATAIATAINNARVSLGLNITAVVNGTTVSLKGPITIYDRGTTAFTVSNNPLVDGEVFTINDGNSTLTFEIDLDGNTTLGNRIVTLLSFDTANTVATKLAAAINLAAANLGFNVTAVAAGSVVTLDGTTVLFQSGSSPLTITNTPLLDGQTFTISDNVNTVTFEIELGGGVTGQNRPVFINPGDSAQNVAAALIAAINLANANGLLNVTATAGPGASVTLAGANVFFDAGNSPITINGNADDPDNFTSVKIDNEFIRVISPELFGSRIVTSTVLPHSEVIFPALSQLPDDDVNGVADRFFNNVRGQDNAHEGFYLDDVIIGLAERGEMVTNPGVNDVVTSGSPIVNLTTGPYDLEIRKGTYYDVFGGIAKNFDTNDRMGQFIELQAPAGPDIQEGDTFTVNDGSQVVTFEFDSDNSILAGHRVVPYTVNDTDRDIAVTIGNAINFAKFQKVLNSTAAAYASGDKVELFNVIAVDTLALDVNAHQITDEASDALQANDYVGHAVDTGVSSNNPGTYMVRGRIGDSVPLAALFNILVTAGNTLVDGTKFTINDGLQTVNFEFDSNGITTLGNQVVPFTAADTVATVIASIMTAINNARIDTTVALDVLAIQNPLAANQITLLGHVLDVSVTGLPFTLIKREGLNNDLDSYKQIRASAGDVIVDGQKFIVSDGINVATFEFDNTFINNGVAAGNIKIAYSPFQTSTEIATVIATAINGSILNLTAGAGSNVVTLGGSIMVFDHGTTALSQVGDPRTLDVDMLKVHLDAGETLEVDLDSDGDSPFYLDTYLRLFRADGTTFEDDGITPLPESDDDPAPGEPTFTSGSYFTYTAITAGDYYIGVSGFGNDAYDPTLAQSGAAGDVGDYTVRVTVGLDSAVSHTAFDFKGDSNRSRDQGYTIISGNRVTQSLEYGIVVDNGTRDVNGPHPGTVRNLREINTLRQVPGVAVVNNVVDGSGTGGILISGDAALNPQGAVPFARVMNNTVYGAAAAAGIGIQITQGAAPTLLNNIVANLAVGILVDATSSAVIGGTAYQKNTADTQGTGGSLGSFAIPTNGSATATNSYFVNAASGNFYPAVGSIIIDSSVNSLPDRANLTTVQAPLGISQSPILAPERDFYGVLRRNDPAVPSPSGLGSNVFKDRGAIDRADFTGPSAQLLDPVDNDGGGVDRNSNVNEVDLVNIQLDEFSIQIVDGVQPADPLNGTGVDDATVTAANVTVTRSGAALVLGTDYTFSYDANNNIIRLVPLAGIWLPGSYVISLNNAAPGGIRDLATNLLKPNQITGETQFRITVGDAFDFGDLPAPYATLLAANGPRHKLDGQLFLGQNFSSEFEGQPNATASADTFDDGVTFPTLTVGSAATLTVNASLPGKLDAWIDFNNDGDFGDPGEKIANSINLVSGSNSLVVTPPTGVGSGQRFARFRLSTAGALAPTGEAADGEVEDYQITIKSNAPFQNAKSAFDVNNNGFITNLDALLVITELRNNGAHSLVPPGPDPSLGALSEGVNAPPYFWDVSGNNAISNLDALLVISDLRANGSHPVGEGISALAGEGEGISSSASETAAPLAPVSFLAAPTVPTVTPAPLAPLASTPVAATSVAAKTAAVAPAALASPAPATTTIATKASADDFWSSLGAITAEEHASDDVISDLAQAWEAELVEDAVFARLQ